MLVWAAIKLQKIGRGKLRRIAVRRTYSQVYRGSRRQLDAANLTIDGGASIAQLAGAVSRERAIALGNAGITLEQLVREICTPILKEWLDTNLPYMVERVVKQEIERIVNRSEHM